MDSESYISVHEYESVHDGDYPEFTNEYIIDLINNDATGSHDDPNPQQLRPSNNTKATQVERREKIAKRISSIVN